LRRKSFYRYFISSNHILRFSDLFRKKNEDGAQEGHVNFVVCALYSMVLYFILQLSETYGVRTDLNRFFQHSPCRTWTTLVVFKFNHGPWGQVIPDCRLVLTTP